MSLGDALHLTDGIWSISRDQPLILQPQPRECTTLDLGASFDGQSDSSTPGCCRVVVVTTCDGPKYELMMSNWLFLKRASLPASWLLVMIYVFNGVEIMVQMCEYLIRLKSRGRWLVGLSSQFVEALMIETARDA